MNELSQGWYLISILIITILFAPFSIDLFFMPRLYLFSILNIILLIISLKKHYFIPKNLNPPHYLFSYLILFSLFSFLKNPSIVLFNIIFLYFFLWIFLNIVEKTKKDNIILVLKFFSIIGFMEGVYGIFQYYKLDPLFVLESWAKESRMAVAGTIGTPAIFGIFLSFSLIVQIYLLINEKKFYFLIFAIPTFYAMILNNTRSAIFGTILSLSYLLFSKFKRKFLIYILILIIIFFIFIFFNKDIKQRWGELFDLKKIHSANIRIFYWKVCIYAIKENPIYGYGPASFSKVYFDNQEKILNEKKVGKIEIIQPLLWAHNDFLQIWIEYGLFGFLLFLISLFWVLFKRDNFYLKKSIAILVFFSSIFLFPFYHPSTLLLIILLFSIQNPYF